MRKQGVVEVLPERVAGYVAVAIMGRAENTTVGSQSPTDIAGSLHPAEEPLCAIPEIRLKYMPDCSRVCLKVGLDFIGQPGPHSVKRCAWYYERVVFKGYPDPDLPLDPVLGLRRDLHVDYLAVSAERRYCLV